MPTNFVEAFAASWIEIVDLFGTNFSASVEAFAASWIEIPVMPYVRVCI